MRPSSRRSPATAAGAGDGGRGADGARMTVAAKADFVKKELGIEAATRAVADRHAELGIDATGMAGQMPDAMTALGGPSAARV